MVFTVKANNITLIGVKSINYTKILNSVTTFEIALVGVSSNMRSNLVAGNNLKIYEDGVLDFEGTISETNSLTGKIVIIRGNGLETDFVETDPPVDSGKNLKVYTSTNDDTIFADIVGAVTGWSSDVSGSTATSVSAFRTSQSMGCWKAIMSLLKLVNKDVYLDYSTKTIYLKDEQGSSDAFKFIEDLNINNLSYSDKKPIASKVMVYGKGDGDNQTIGSAGSGTPVKRITDRNIINETEADNRAAKELALINSNTKNYDFDVNNSRLNIDIGDKGTLTANSAGLNNAGVDIVKITKGISTNNEFLKVQVTNHSYRIASTKLTELIYKNSFDNINSDSSMNGSGNTLTYAGGINGNDTAPLRLLVSIPSTLVTDEAGNVRVTSFTIDYDVDEFRSSIGTSSSSLDNTGNSITNSQQNASVGISNDTNNADVGISNDSQTPTATGIVSVWTGCPSDSMSSIGYVEENSTGSGVSLYTTRGETLAANWTGMSQTVDLEFEFPSGNTNYDGSASLGNNSTRRYNTGETDSDNDSGWFYAKDNNENASNWIGICENIYSHTHGSHTHNNSTTGGNHYHNNSTTNGDHTHSNSYNDGTHDHTVNVTDGAEDSGSVNATELASIKLYYWNGSSWVLKNTISNTGKTIDTDVDLSDSGTYPDNAGFWKVEILTDSSSPDLIKANIYLKHNLDN